MTRLARGSFLESPENFLGPRKAIRKTPTRLLCLAGLFICCRGNGNKNNCKVLCFEQPSFLRYKQNYVIRNAPKNSWDFRKTVPSFDKWEKVILLGET